MRVWSSCAAMLLVFATALCVICSIKPTMALPPVCHEPPFITPGVQSNVLVILDNSGSMCWFAYQEATGSFNISNIPQQQYAVTPPSGTSTCRDTLNCGQWTKSTPCTSPTQDCGDVSAQFRGNGDLSGCWGTCTFSYVCKWVSSKCTRQYSSTPSCTLDGGDCNLGQSWRSSTETMTVTLSQGGVTAYGGYEQGKKYYGLFDPDRTYKYYNSDGKHYFEAVGNVVDPGGVKDSSGNLVVVRAACVGTSSCDRFSGNWLNWLTMRRIDVAKKVLTGGRLGGDTSNYVLVGSPHGGGDNDWKVFNDDGKDKIKGTSINTYYTPFKDKKFGIYFYTSPDLVQRTTTKGKFVPLFVFFEASSYNDSTHQVTAKVPFVNLSAASTSNSGESSLSGKRAYDGSYYVAVKHGTVADDEPPAGIIQNMASKVRIGYMKFNFGQGPADGSSYSLGKIYDRFDIDGDGTGPYLDEETGRRYDLIRRYADGGRIVNRVGDVTRIDSWQQNSAGTPVQIYDLVQNVNETLWEGATPIAEVLREAKRYFQQVAPAYAWVDSGGTLQPDFQVSQAWDDTAQTAWDPYFIKQPNDTVGKVQECAKSFIILVSDGEENSANPNYDSCQTLNCTTRTAAPASEYDADVWAPDGKLRFDDTGTYMDDIAYIMYTQDMRLSGVPGKQTISTYTVLAFDNSTNAKYHMQSTALQGGFTDLNNDGQAGKAKPAGQTSDDWRTSYNWSGWDGYIEWDVDKDKNPDHFFQAADGYLLETYIQSIFTQISLGGGVGAVATISQNSKEGDIIVRGAFDAVDPVDRTHYLWNGHLEVYWPDDLGKYEFEYSENTSLFCRDMVSGHCDGSKCCWDAGEIMQRLLTTPTSPHIISYVNGQQKDLTVANASFFTDLMRQKPSTANPTGAVDTNLASAIIQWTRGKYDSEGYPLTDGGARFPSGCVVGGDSTHAACIGPYRNRKGAKLGDIVYSTPVVVGPPPLGGVSAQDPDAASFYDFRNANLNRARVAYVGANDGMIHAYLLARWETTTDPTTGKTSSAWNYQCSAGDGYPSCGQEIWSYVPSNLLSELFALASTSYGRTGGGQCSHRSMVDLSSKAWDVYIQSDACTATCCAAKRCWRTVIIGGERGGGDTYFAIDITDPVNPKVLWEHSVLKNLAVVYNEGSSQKMALPFREHDNDGDGLDDVYFNLKTMRTSWSEPIISRVRFPASSESGGVSFWRYIKNTSGIPVLDKKSFSTNKCTSSGVEVDCSDNKREIAFIGGGFREFQLDPFTPVTPYPNNDTVKQAIIKPYLLALDVETGENLFQVAWALLVKARTDAGKLPTLRMPSTAPASFVPRSLGDINVLDVWNDNDGSDDLGRFAEDGFADRLYVGDLHGYFYRMAFNFKTFQTTSKNPTYWGMNINYWPTKPLRSGDLTDPASCDQQNAFRGCRQPIAYAPAVAVDSGSLHSSSPALRVLFGTGKLDDPPNDNDDQARMSFYNLKDAVRLFSTPDGTGKWALPPINPVGSGQYTISKASTPGAPDTVTPSGSGWDKGFTINDTHFGIIHGDCMCYDESSTDASKYLRWAGLSCDDTRGDKCCNWATSANTPDCCEQATVTPIANATRSCPNCASSSSTDCPTTDSSGQTKPCWSCIFDFSDAGERVVGKAVISGGYVFFTTYTPPDPGCSTGGTGRLYIMDYRCKTFPDNFNPLLGSGGYSVTQLTTTEAVPHQYGIAVNLGTGMPSRPVLDSKGQSVLIQKSDGTFVRFPAPKFLVAPIQFKGGWTEK